MEAEQKPSFVFIRIVYFGGGVASHRAFSRVPMATSGFAVVPPLQVRMLGPRCPSTSPINRVNYESKDLVLGAGSGSVFP